MGYERIARERVELLAEKEALTQDNARKDGAITLAIDLMVEAESHEDYTQAIRALEYALDSSQIARSS